MSSLRFLRLLPAGVLLVVAGSAVARKDTKEATPAVVQQLINCRALTDANARLSCFDTQVAALDQATQSREIVVVEKAQVTAARKGLFGFRLPSLGLFGGRDHDEADEIKEITSVVSSARKVGYGEWRFTIEDGAVWEQSDSAPIVFEPRRGSKVVIKRGALGSYKASIDGQPGVKVRRVE